MATTETGQSTQELAAVTWNDDVEQDDDDLEYFEDEDLPGRPPPKRLGPFTMSLIALVFAAVAFYGGVLVEKHNVGASSGGTSAAISSLISRFRGTGAAGAGTGTGTGAAGASSATSSAAGGAAAAFAGRSGTTGTVTLVDGSNVYVTVSGGNIVKVLTNPASQITTTQPGTVASLQPGDSVTVTGPTDSSGDQTALTIRDNGAGGAAGGGGGGRGAAAGG